MKTPKILIVLVVFVFSFSIGSILNTLSEYKFPKDTKLEYKISNESKQETTVMGREQSFTNSTSENMHILSLGLVDDNNFKVEFYLDNINISTDNPMVNVKSLDLSFITNKKSSALVSKKGVVSSVEEIDVIELPQDAMLQGIIQRYRPLAFFSRFFLVFPENDLNVGDTWSDSKTTGGDITTVTDYSYAVSEIVDYKGYSCLKIVCSIKITMDGQGVASGQEYKTSGKGEGNETYYFAQDKGILVGYEKNQVTNINVDMIAMEMTIPSTSTVSSKVELVK